MKPVSEQLKKEVLDAYQFHGTLLSFHPYGNGHINDTFLLIFDIYGMGRLKIILQRVNTDVFTNPIELMDNVIQCIIYKMHTEYTLKKYEQE